MSLAIKPTDPMERIEEETRKEIQNELEKDLAALGVAVTAYFVELWGLSEKEKEKRRWERALERWAEKKAEEGIQRSSSPWEAFKDPEKAERERVRFFTITTSGVEEVQMDVEEAGGKEERAVDAALLSRSPEPVEEVVAQPLIEEGNMEQVEELLEKGDEERAVDVLVVESPARIEAAMERKAELEKVVEERRRLILQLVEEAKRLRREVLKDWIRKRLPPLLRAKYLLLLERLGPEGVRKAALRELEVLGSLLKRLRAMGVREIVAAGRRAGRKVVAFLKRLLRMG